MSLRRGGKPKSRLTAVVTTAMRDFVLKCGNGNASEGVNRCIEFAIQHDLVVPYVDQRIRAQHATRHVERVRTTINVSYSELQILTAFGARSLTLGLRRFANLSLAWSLHDVPDPRPVEHNGGQRHAKSVSLPQIHIDALTLLGGGNLSDGVRRAAYTITAYGLADKTDAELFPPGWQPPTAETETVVSVDE